MLQIFLKVSIVIATIGTLWATEIPDKAEVFMAASEVFATNKENAMQETLNRLDEGKKFLNLSESQDIIVVVGNTGSGKTAFTHYVAGDYSQLTAVKANNNPYSQDYVIDDPFDKISGKDQTTVSKTILPELVVDEDGIAWYDCPGFSDTRNTSVEIATTYFVKNVIDHAKSVKVLFVVNQGSTLVGYDRTDFDRMVRHAINLVKNVGRYKLSMGLILSKAEAYPPRTTEPIPEWAATNLAGDFISSYRKDVQIDKENDETTQTIVTLLDAFLDKHADGNYSQIGVFWRPDKAGPLNESTLLANGRKSLRKMITQHLVYEKVEQDDFGFTLSDKAQNDLSDLAQQINHNITESVRKIGDDTITAYKQKEKELNNFVEKKNIFVNAQLKLFDLKDNVQNLTAKQLLSKLVNFTEEQRIFIPKSNLENIENQQKYLLFLDLVSKKKLPVSQSDWVIALDKCYSYILEEQNWYVVLTELYNILSGYKYQKDLSLYNVRDLSKWGVGAKEQGIFINNYNFMDFLKLHRNYYELLKTMKVNEIRLKGINDLLNITLKHVVEHKCVGDDTMIVTGEYLKMSEVKLQHCGARIKNVHLFAINTFFADANIKFQGENKELAIMAKKWETVRDVTFTINGEDSKFVPGSQPEPTALLRKGKPGIPGKAGSNGVNFIGLTDQIVNSDQLSINANGGMGSIGQDGGKSYPEAPHLPPGTFDDWTGEKALDKQGYSKHVFLNATYLTFTDIVYRLKQSKGKQHWHLHHEVFIDCCGPDGPAGSGGRGGNGGQVKIFHLNPAATQEKPNISNYTGRTGPNGKNVEACRTENHIFVYNLYYENLFWGGFEHHGEFTFHRADLNPWCKKSNNDFNDVEREKPKDLRPLDAYVPIISYKSFLRQNLNTGMRAFDLMDFYTKIEKNEDIQNYYDIHGLVQELQSYEDHFYQLNSDIDFLPFYEHLIERILAFSEKYSDKTTKEEKKVLAWLYTAATSKAYGLRNNRQGYLIIDIQNYLDVAMGSIEDFKNMGKQEMINKHKNKYKEELDAKVNEAMNFIDKDVSPEFDLIYKKLDKVIEGLVEETITKQNDTLKTLSQQEKNKKELQKNMQHRLLVGVLKGIGQCVSFLGPIGKGAGTAIDTATNIGGQFIVDPDTPQKNFVLPSGVKDTLEKAGEIFQARKDKKIKALDDELAEIKKQMEKDTEVSTVIGGDTKKALENIKEALDKAKSKDGDEELVDTLNERYTKLMKERQKELEGKKEKPMKGHDRAVKVMKHAANLAEIASTGLDIYNQFKEDEEKIEKVAQSIRETREELHQYKQYELKIYKTLMPMILQASDQFKDVEKNLGGKSHVALDIQSWRVQSTLSDLKHDLVKFTKGFQAEEDVQRCVEKLTEAMDTLIDIYDRIQNYEEQEKLVVYIGNLHSTHFESISISDSRLSAGFSKLELMVTSNVILAQYLRAINGFKQIVFPFASTYMETFDLPASLVVDSSMTSLVTSAANQLKTLKVKIKELNETVVNNNDAVIHTGDFNGNNKALEPFYVWKHEEYNQTIHELLSGKKVHLMADITKGLHYNAIKFSTIGIEFRHRDKQLQKNFTDELDHFYVHMTHMGNSFYRCKNRFFKSTSPSQQIEYSYEKKGDRPSGTNGVYDKLRDGNIILSPYTMWEVHLERGKFENLKQYLGSIDIELYGFGQYVKEGASICDENLSKYYSLDENVNEVDDVDDGALMEAPTGPMAYMNFDLAFF